MFELLGVGLHIWSSLIILATLIAGYFVFTSCKITADKVRYGIIGLGAVIILAIYMLLTPVVGEQLESMDLMMGSSKKINLALLLSGASVVTLAKYFIFDKMKYRK